MMSLPVIYQQKPLYERHFVYQYKMMHNMMTVAQENLLCSRGRPTTNFMNLNIKVLTELLKRR